MGDGRPLSVTPFQSIISIFFCLFVIHCSRRDIVATPWIRMANPSIQNTWGTINSADSNPLVHSAIHSLSCDYSIWFYWRRGAYWDLNFIPLLIGCLCLAIERQWEAWKNAELGFCSQSKLDKNLRDFDEGASCLSILQFQLNIIDESSLCLCPRINETTTRVRLICRRPRSKHWRTVLITRPIKVHPAIVKWNRNWKFVECRFIRRLSLTINL